MGSLKDLHKKINLSQLKEILKTGGAISFTVGTELATMLAVSTISGMVGETEQAAMTFIMQVIFFISLVVTAFSLASAQEISRALGAKKYEHVKAIANGSLVATLCCAAPFPLVCIAYPKALIAISGGANPDIASILEPLIRIMSAGVIADAVRYNLLQQLRGMGDLLIPNIIAIMGLLLVVALSVGLGLNTSLGINGVGMAFAIGSACAAIALLIRWCHIKRPDVLAQTAASEPTSCFSAVGNCVSSICSRFSFFRRQDTRRLLPEASEQMESSYGGIAQLQFV